MRSLKGTLFRGVILGTAFVLLIAGTILYVSVTRQLVNQMDESLTDKVRTLALSIEEKPYGLEVDLEEMRMEEMEEAESPEYLCISFPDGRVIHCSSILTGINVSVHTAPLEEPRHEWYIIKGVGRVRSVIYSFRPEVDDEEESESAATSPDVIVVREALPGGRIVIQLFMDASGYVGFTRTFLLVLIGTGFGSLGVLSLTVWVAVKRGAEPINELAELIESTRDDDPIDRLDEKAVLEELIPIARKFNLFLGRLEESFNRERAFTSDAAHELRTPLAGLKAMIEVTLSRDREGGEYRQTLKRALVILKQLENLTGSLLALARLESGQEVFVPVQVRLQKIVSETWDDHRPDADLKDLDVSINPGNAIAVTADRDLLVSVIDELFRNAVHYTDQGGSIRVDMRQEDSHVSLTISNTGSKVSAGDAGHVFNRFWRGSEFQDDTGKRFGLGLPIARKIIEIIGGELVVQSDMGREFKVTVTLPVG